MSIQPMRHTKLPSLFVVLLLVTAGCLGGGAGADTTPAADASGSSSGSGGDSGGNGGGDAANSGDGSLVENRTAALIDAGSYTSIWRMESFEDGAQVSEMAYTTKIDYENERFSFQMKSTNDGETRTATTMYYADGKAYQKFGEGDDASMMSNEAEFGTVAHPRQMAFVSSSGDLSDFSYAGTETFNGVTVKRYEMDKVAPWISAQQQSDGEVKWTDFSYVVLVDEQGLVRSEYWEGNGVDDSDTKVTIKFSYEVTDVGSTQIAEPSWLDEASS